MDNKNLDQMLSAFGEVSRKYDIETNPDLCFVEIRDPLIRLCTASVRSPRDLRDLARHILKEKVERLERVVGAINVDLVPRDEPMSATPAGLRKPYHGGYLTH